MDSERHAVTIGQTDPKNDGEGLARRTAIEAVRLPSRAGRGSRRTTIASEESSSGLTEQVRTDYTSLFGRFDTKRISGRIDREVACAGSRGRGDAAPYWTHHRRDRW